MAFRDCHYSNVRSFDRIADDPAEGFEKENLTAVADARKTVRHESGESAFAKKFFIASGNFLAEASLEYPVCIIELLACDHLSFGITEDLAESVYENAVVGSGGFEIFRQRHPIGVRIRSCVAPLPSIDEEVPAFG